MPSAACLLSTSCIKNVHSQNWMYGTQVYRLLPVLSNCSIPLEIACKNIALYYAHIKNAQRNFLSVKLYAAP